MKGALGGCVAWRSIRLRLAVIVLLCALPVAVLGLRSAREHRRLLVTEAGEQLQTTARLLGAERGRRVDAVLSSLRALSQAPQLAGSDRQACRGLLAARLNDAPDLVDILLTTGDGELLCAGRPGAAASRQIPTGAAMPDGSVVGPAAFAGPRQDLVLPISLLLPAGAGGAGRVLTANLATTDLDEFITRAQLPEGTLLTLLDATDRVLASTVPGLLPGDASPWPLPAPAVSVVQAGDQLLGIAAARGGDLKIVVSRSRRLVVAPSDAIFRRELVLMAVVVTLAGLAAALVAELTIARRVRLLAHVAGRLAVGDMGARADLPGGKDEVGRLADAFNRMACSIEGQVYDLSTRVAEARHAALHDPLTGLPNRRAFADELETALVHAATARGRVAVLALDLDRFKAINDTHGHASGDALLAAAAQRMTRAVRDTDQVARIAGDEFSILLPELDDPRTAERVAERVLSVMGRPFELNGRRVESGVSIGIAQYPDDATHADGLQLAADRALYRAKRAGRGRWCRGARLSPATA